MDVDVDMMEGGDQSDEEEEDLFAPPKESTSTSNSNSKADRNMYWDSPKDPRSRPTPGDEEEDIFGAPNDTPLSSTSDRNGYWDTSKDPRSRPAQVSTMSYS